MGPEQLCNSNSRSSDAGLWLLQGWAIRVGLLLLLASRSVWLWRLRQRRILSPTSSTLLAKWSLDAVSAVFLAVVVVFVQAAPTPSLGFAWALAEAGFFLWYSRRLAFLDAIGLNSLSDAFPHSILPQGLHVFSRLLDEREGALPLLQRYPHHIRNWFMGSHGDAPIGVGNVAELLDHLLMQGQAKKAGKAPESDDENESTFETMLHNMATSLWSRLGLDQAADADDQAAGTYVAGAKPISPADQPLMACYRPLLFYILMEAIAGWTHMVLTLRLGFRRCQSTATATYYVKQGRKPNRPPIVFLHGIGIGIAPYVAFIARLAQRTGRTVIAVQYKHVSMRMTHHVPSATEVATDVEAFLRSRGHHSVSIVAHSYGTLVASSLVKQHPDRVSSLTLLDPVCFAMFLPHLLRNSLFFHVNEDSDAASAGAGAAGNVEGVGAQPGNRKVVRVGSWLKNPLKGVVVRDVHVAAALSRNNHWAEVNLWPTDLPSHAPTTVVLSGNDHLVPVTEVVDMLSGSVAANKGVKVHVHPGKGHGAFVLDPDIQDSIIVSLGGMSAAAYQQRAARARAAPSFARASLVAITDVAARLQSLVQSVQAGNADTTYMESDDALRMLAPGLARTSSRGRPAGNLCRVPTWPDDSLSLAALADCSILDSVACSGGDEPRLLPIPLESPSRPHAKWAARRVAAVAPVCSGPDVVQRLPLGTRLGLRGPRVGPWAAGHVGPLRRPGLMRFRPLQRLSPMGLIRVCSRMLTARRAPVISDSPSAVGEKRGGAFFRGGLFRPMRPGVPR